MQDKEGMTVAMHAAKSCSLATLLAVLAEIENTQVRTPLTARRNGVQDDDACRAPHRPASLDIAKHEESARSNFRARRKFS